MKDKDIMKLSSLVLNKLLSRNHKILYQLNNQYSESKVVSIENTIVGFYVNFSVPEHVDRIKDVKQSFFFGDVSANIKGINNGIGFLVHVKDGKLDFLEGYTYDEKLPELLDDIFLFFTKKSDDLTWLDIYYS